MTPPWGGWQAGGCVEGRRTHDGGRRWGNEVLAGFEGPAWVSLPSPLHHFTASLPAGIHPLLAPRDRCGWDVQGTSAHTLPGEWGICWTPSSPPSKPPFPTLPSPASPPGCRGGGKGQARAGRSGGSGAGGRAASPVGRHRMCQTNRESVWATSISAQTRERRLECKKETSTWKFKTLPR